MYREGPHKFKMRSPMSPWLRAGYTTQVKTPTIFLDSSYYKVESKTQILEVEHQWEREVLESVGVPALPEERFQKCHSPKEDYPLK